MGLLVLLVGLAGLGVGLFQHFKAKRILAAPFKKTGELAQNPTSPDPKGLISTEGNVVAGTPLLSPCSQTPCLYYEVEVIRHGEKTELTQDGTKTEKKKETVETLKKGLVFSLDDGSGAIPVDATQGGDFDNLKKKFEEKVKLGLTLPGELKFGELKLRTPRLPNGESTIAFEAIEKIVPAEGKLFALGKIDKGVIGKPGWRSMMFSSKGRDGLLASTAKVRKIGFIAGGVATIAAIPLMIFGPSGGSRNGIASCDSKLNGVVATCSDNVTTDNRYKWTVSTAGEYELTVTPPAGKTFALNPELTLKDASGAELASSHSTPASVRRRLEPGQYTVTVKESTGLKVKGGYDYTFAIAQTDAPAVAAAGAAVAARAPANPAICEDGESITDARTCKVKVSEDGATFEWEVTTPGQYTITVLPFGAKSVKEPVLKIDDEERSGKGSVTVTRVFTAGTHSVTLLDYAVSQEAFPIEATLAILSTPAPGKRVAGGNVVPAGGTKRKKR
jgi:hypothetical protein